MKISHLVTAAALTLGTLTAMAHSYKAGDIDIGHPFARATAPGQPTGGGYMKFSNGGAAADKLIGASADVSKAVELHSMKMEGDVMRMRQVDAIELPAGKAVALEPGGLHIMFVGLKAPLKAGDSFPLKLRFEKAGEVMVQIKVEAPGAAAAAASSAAHKH